MDRQKYDAPEPKEETRSRGIVFLLLAGAVVLGMVLLATGVVQVR
ncbi:MAG: hypothetical protein ACRDOY_06170 [Nocardioidaceae bacterium]